MGEFFATLADLAIAVFAVTSMLSVGLANRLRRVIRPLRRGRIVARVLLANFVLVPALAFLVTEALSLDDPFRHGLILISVGAGAPFLIKLSATAGGSLRITATMLVLLLPVTIVYMPVVVPLLLPGAQVSLLAIAAPLVVTMLLPLGLGLLVRERWPTVAGRVQPIMGEVSSVALIVVVIATTLANYEAIIGIGWRPPLAALVIVLGAFAMGYLIGGIDPDNREVIGLGTGQRNIAAATVVASQAFGNAQMVVMVIVASLIGLAVLFPIARLLWRRERQRYPEPESVVH